MKKRLLFAAMAMFCAMGSFAYEVGEYAYTATQRVKITGENLVTNGNFADGTEGWTDAAGEAVNVDVWSFVEGAGPNGENVLQSMSASTADAALCGKWAVPESGGYLVMLDIKGEAVAYTTRHVGATNSIDFWFSANADDFEFNRKMDRLLIKDKNGNVTHEPFDDGTLDLAISSGYTAEWSTIAFYAIGEEGRNILMRIEKLTANTQITNIQIYKAEEVFDDRVLRTKIDFVDKLIATGKFTKDTDNGFVENIIETLRGMLETPGALDDKSSIDGMMESYEEEFNAWLVANGADMLAGEKRWSAYGDTRKMNGIGGNWQGTGGRWFHANNGGSTVITDNGDEIGHRFQGGMAAGAASQYYPLTPKAPGTYMFALDITGYYMEGSSGSSYDYLEGTSWNYIPFYTREFQGVTMFAGKDIMGSDAEANEAMNVEQEGQKVYCGAINNANARNNCQKFVVFYEVSQADVDAGTPIYFGITYVPTDAPNKLGSNVNIAHPQIILIGETQEEADYKNEVAAIITQQGPLRDRLQWAREDLVNKTRETYYPWGQAALQEAIDTYQPVYDESLTIIDADGNVLNESFIREKLAAHDQDETATLYSEDLLAAVRALNSARSTYTRTNQIFATFNMDLANAEAVLADGFYTGANLTDFKAAIDEAKRIEAEVLASTTDETRDADIETLNAAREALAAAQQTFKDGASLKPFVDIDFSQAATENPEGGYIIAGAAGQMTIATNFSTDNTSTGTQPFTLGYGEENLEVLRVGNGSAVVTFDEDNVPGESDVIRAFFDLWAGNLSGKNVFIDFRNANGQRVAGFSMSRYSGTVAYNEFNNDENTGLNILSYVSGLGSSSVGDNGIFTTGNKSSFDLKIDYANKTVSGQVINGTNGTCNGVAVPMIMPEDGDNVITQFVVGSNYDSADARRCWFDNLKIFKYAGGTVGDTNGDGAVDVADISAVISAMAEGNTDATFDVNGDGAVDVADISAIITIMATN